MKSLSTYFIDNHETFRGKYASQRIYDRHKRGNIVTTPIQDQGAGALYRSGTAARLAGIPVATLRMWERRYRIVGPQTSARGHRRYAAEDVNRLALVKSLVDRGHPIGTVAHLPLQTLREMRSAAGAAVTAPRAAPPRTPRVAIVGEALCAQASAADAASMDVAATCADRTQAAEALRDVRADVLAIELPALRDDDVDFVETLAALVGARRAIVAYRFATEAALRELRRRGHAVAHAPIGLAEIASLAGGFETGPAPLAAPPAPRFDERALAQFSRVASKVRCECPKHVADLLLSLGAFERYSAECENRSPADAELHRHLGRVAGNARLLFEEALIRVARAEGIELPEGRGGETPPPPAGG
jgi:DNA-binding transcriptional MerR regulator